LLAVGSLWPHYYIEDYYFTPSPGGWVLYIIAWVAPFVKQRLTVQPPAIQFRIVIRRTSRVVRGLLSRLISTWVWLYRAAPVILTAGAVGLLAGLGLSLFQPRLYAAVTVISLEPEI